MLPTALPDAGQGIRMQAGVTSAASQLAAHASRSPARQFRGPGMSAQPSVSMPVAPGVEISETCMLVFCRQLMAEHQQKLAAKVFEPYRPQLLADQVRDLKVMVFEASLQQHTGKVPAFLSRAQEFQHAANMDLQEEEQACHRAFEHILEMADAGKHHAIAVWHTTAWWSCCQTCTVQNTFAACELVTGSMSPDFFQNDVHLSMLLSGMLTAFSCSSLLD